LLFFIFVQDIGHAHGAYKPPPASMSQTLLSLAGFQVIISGRFWVIAEDIRKAKCAVRAMNTPPFASNRQCAPGLIY